MTTVDIFFKNFVIETTITMKTIKNVLKIQLYRL